MGASIISAVFTTRDIPAHKNAIFTTLDISAFTTS